MEKVQGENWDYRCLIVTTTDGPVAERVTLIDRR